MKCVTKESDLVISGIGENMEDKPKTVEIRLTKEEFEKLKTVRQEVRMNNEQLKNKNLAR